jgi:hypothetical protein
MVHPLEQLTPSGEELAASYSRNLPSSADKPAPSTQLTAAFHGSNPARLAQFEKPWMRSALHLAARAKMSAVEIARSLDVSADSVRNLFKQPWFQERFDQLVSNRADSLYERLLEGEDVNSLLTIIELRDNPEVKQTVRAAAAFDILDRMKGKAIQRVHSVHQEIKSKEDIDALKKEYEELLVEEQGLLGATAQTPNANGITRPASN